jgi:hypothetical protein
MSMNDGSIVRGRGTGEQRWFFGGGLHTWMATAEESNLHTHPDADEAFYVLQDESSCSPTARN